jgi:hypothetical protein
MVLDLLDLTLLGLAPTVVGAAIAVRNWMTFAKPDAEETARI